MTEGSNGRLIDGEVYTEESTGKDFLYLGYVDKRNMDRAGHMFIRKENWGPVVYMADGILNERGCNLRRTKISFDCFEREYLKKHFAQKLPEEEEGF
jgi:hypothetical protein